MVNYSIAEFLGIFCLGFPILCFATIIPIWGIFQIVKHFFKEEEKEEAEKEEEEEEEKEPENIFHHHYHYKSR